MSEKFLDRIERLTGSLEKLEGFMDKLPRLIEMGGVAFFAGRASEKLGGDFKTGALGGMVVDGLAHSQLPNNQIGGLSIAAYFTLLGITNLAPITEKRNFDDFTEEFDAALASNEIRVTRSECESVGGTPIKAILGAFGADGRVQTVPIPSGQAGLIPPSVQVVCKLPAALPPQEGGEITRPPISGQIRR